MFSVEHLFYLICNSFRKINSVYLFPCYLHFRGNTSILPGKLLRTLFGVFSWADKKLQVFTPLLFPPKRKAILDKSSEENFEMSWTEQLLNSSQSVCFH